MRDGRWFDRAELDRRLLASPQRWIRLMVNPKGFGLGWPGFVRGLLPMHQ